ncbi:MAG TPA: hypothetical protein VJ024_08940, partial [Thermodesulfovibrionales bacterium]|nr:hypothetical protein [Thermodesulfovibrionales bacterium]
VRGMWHEKIRRYEPLVTLAEGKDSVEKVVGAVVDKIDGRTGVNATFIAAKPRIVVLANSIDYSMATDLFGFMGNRGIEVIKASAENFHLYKSEKFIVILGGPDAPEGVGEIVKEVLSEVQVESIREEGARRRYTKTNFWIQGQRVTVIAGSDRNATMKSHEEHREDVALEAEETLQ